MPTFCRGWGNLPFDRSSADLTAHALRAWLAWRDTVPLDLQARMRTATSLALRYLERNQQADGAWAPLWFGNQHAPDEINLTYGTSRVLVALVALRQCGQLPDHYLANLTSGLAWLVGVQNGDGGWGGAANTPSSVEETSLAVEALCFALDANPEGRQALAPGDADQTAEGARRGLEWLLKNTDCGRHFPASPIGFYFAKLWYFERLYPVSFAIAALSRADQVRTRLWPQPEMPARAPR
jgi:squalene-hopene/tetraprenyl-beta-curcumene cyclase